MRHVVPGGAGDAMVSVNPILIKGGRLFQPNNTGTPKFSDLPTALVARGRGYKYLTDAFNSSHLKYLYVFGFITFLNATISFILGSSILADVITLYVLHT